MKLGTNGLIKIQSFQYLLYILVLECLESFLLAEVFSETKNCHKHFFNSYLYSENNFLYTYYCC